MCCSASASGHYYCAALKLLVPCFACAPCIYAPHANLLTSVEIVKSHSTVQLGGTQRLPTSVGWIYSQYFSRVLMEAADNLTVTPQPQPGLEFKSLYSTTKFWQPFDNANVVNYR